MTKGINPRHGVRAVELGCEHTGHTRNPSVLWGEAALWKQVLGVGLAQDGRPWGEREGLLVEGRSLVPGPLGAENRQLHSSHSGLHRAGFRQNGTH